MILLLNTMCLFQDLINLEVDLMCKTTLHGSKLLRVAGRAPNSLSVFVVKYDFQ